MIRIRIHNTAYPRYIYYVPCLCKKLLVLMELMLGLLLLLLLLLEVQSCFQAVGYLLHSILESQFPKIININSFFSFR